MRNVVKIVLLISLMAFASGCFSPRVYEDSQRKVAMRKAIVSNNQAAIQAIRLGDDGVGFGINLTAWEVLKEQPVKQATAALGDALLIWGGYEGVRYIEDEIDGNSDDDGSANGQNVSGRDTTIINGDHNTVNNGSGSEFDDGPQIVPVY